MFLESVDRKAVVVTDREVKCYVLTGSIDGCLNVFDFWCFGELSKFQRVNEKGPDVNAGRRQRRSIMANVVSTCLARPVSA